MTLDTTCANVKPCTLFYLSISQYTYQEIRSKPRTTHFSFKCHLIKVINNEYNSDKKRTGFSIGK